MSTEDHSRFEHDLAAYLLDAMTAAEAERFEGHLTVCERCRGDARWLQTAADALPSSVEQLDPPPGLRERLLETVREEAAGRSEPPRRERARWWRRPALAWRTTPALAVTLLALVAAGLAGYLIGSEDEPRTTTIAAQPTPAQPDARGSIVRSGDTAVLHVERLPVQQRGHEYQVWLRPKGSKTVEPSSLFVVKSDGSGAAGIPGGLEGVEEVMVSLEPAGGSRRPTTRPVLRASV